MSRLSGAIRCARQVTSRGTVSTRAAPRANGTSWLRPTSELLLTAAIPSFRRYASSHQGPNGSGNESRYGKLVPYITTGFIVGIVGVVTQRAVLDVSVRWSSFTVGSGLMTATRKVRWRAGGGSYRDEGASVDSC